MLISLIALLPVLRETARHFQFYELPERKREARTSRVRAKCRRRGSPFPSIRNSSREILGIRASFGSEVSARTRHGIKINIRRPIATRSTPAYENKAQPELRAIKRARQVVPRYTRHVRKQCNVSSIYANCVSLEIDTIWKKWNAEKSTSVQEHGRAVLTRGTGQLRWRESTGPP